MSTTYLRNFAATVAMLLAAGTYLAPMHSAPAQDEAPAEEVQDPAELEKLANFQYRTGTIIVGSNLATLDLGQEYRYLPPAETERLLVEYWGNPPGNETLGMIIPATVNPLSSEGWGVVVTYSDDGHVKDKDAEKIDYQDLLKDMQKGTKEANKERVAQGYESIQLVGWAESPHYDKATHKLFWAKELSFDGVQPHTLNYNVRVLGRSGVLNLNAISTMDQLDEIRPGMEDLLPKVNFKEGNMYADFNEGTDKVAAYGVAGLVAGGVAAKAGLFKGLLLGLLAMKKLGIVIVVAVGAGLVKFGKAIMGKRGSDGTEA